MFRFASLFMIRWSLWRSLWYCHREVDVIKKAHRLEANRQHIHIHTFLIVQVQPAHLLLFGLQAHTLMIWPWNVWLFRFSFWHHFDKNQLHNCIQFSLHFFFPTPTSFNFNQERSQWRLRNPIRFIVCVCVCLSQPTAHSIFECLYLCEPQCSFHLRKINFDFGLVLCKEKEFLILNTKKKSEIKVKWIFW